MTEEEAFDDIPSLAFLVDQAAEAIRRANHHTFAAREVTDLGPVLGALHALFSRFDQLAGYLHTTVRNADPADFRHDHDDGNVTTLLGLIGDSLADARNHAGLTTRFVGNAWAHLGYLTPLTPDLTCPECGEPAYRGIPIDLTPAQRSAATRPRHRHADGTQLCPATGEHGYEPALPIRAD